jgi:polysaccharide biosynthesis protein PslE
MDNQEPKRASLRDLLHVVFKRKTQIILFFGATMLAVAGGTFLATPSYEALSSIMVKIGREDVYVPATGVSAPVIRHNREEQINSEIEILKSQALAEDVVNFFGPAALYGSSEEERGGLRKFLSKAHAAPSPAQKAVVKLQKSLKVEGVRSSSIIVVSFTHKDPQMAADVVNKMMSFYLERHLQVHKYPHSQEFFEEQSGVLRSTLSEAENALKKFKKENAITSLEEERTLLLQEVAQLRVAANDTSSQLAETENRINQLRLQMAETPRIIAQGEEIDHSPALIGSLQTRLVELQLREQEMLSKYTDQSRFVQQVKEELRVVKQKLAEQESKRSGRSSYGINSTHQMLQDSLFRNEAEMKALSAKMSVLSNQLSQSHDKLNELNKLEVELSRLTREVDVHRQNHQLYLTKAEESRISDAMDQQKISNVSLVQSATPPISPVSPRVTLNLALGLFLGLFGGITMAFFIEHMDDSLEKPEDVEELLDLPVLASIPRLQTGPRNY